MNEFEPQLKRLFTSAKPLRRARMASDASAPLGFAARVAHRYLSADRNERFAVRWGNLSRWGLGFACGLMLLSLAWNWNLLNAQWSPALAVAEHVSEFVSMP